MNKLGFDLMASGLVGVGVDVLDEIKAISAQLRLGFGLSLAISQSSATKGLDLG